MRKELIVEKNPKSPIAEIFRAIRTNIQFMDRQKSLKTLLITSTMPGEGKSWVASNLAATFAQAGKKVVLIDADLRKGRLHKMFQIDGVPGLSNYLSGFGGTEDVADNDNDIFNYIKETEVANLYVIPSGNFPPNPSELLTSELTKNMLDKLKETFDIIILDGTPCLLVSDSVILSRIVDSTVIVTAYKLTKKDNLVKTKKAIENVGGKIAGVVLNKLPINIDRYESSYYYSTSKPEDEKMKTHKNESKVDLKSFEGKELKSSDFNKYKNYEIENKDNISEDKTNEIMKQIDDFLKNNNNN